MSTNLLITGFCVNIPMECYEASFDETVIKNVIPTFTDEVFVKNLFEKAECLSKPRLTVNKGGGDSKWIYAIQYRLWDENTYISQEELQYFENDFVALVNTKCQNANVPFSITSIKADAYSKRMEKTLSAIDSIMSKFSK